MFPSKKTKNGYSPLRNSARLMDNSQLLMINPVADAMKMTPKVVLRLLEKYPRLVLAGSAVLSSVRCVSLFAPSDYDLFICGKDVTDEEATSILHDVISLGDEVARTGAAVTVLLEDEDLVNFSVDEATIVIQVVLHIFESPEHVLHSFDLAPCKVCMGRFEEEAPLQIRATSGWVHAMRHQAFWVDTDAWSAATLFRIFKYYTRGFDVFVTTLDRGAFNRNGKWLLPNTMGISTVFRVERAVGAAMWRDDYRARPSTSVLNRIVRRCVRSSRARGWWRSSGYEEEFSRQRSMADIVRAILRFGMRWIGLVPEVRDHARDNNKDNDTDVAMVRWARAPKQGNLYPVAPNFHGLYDFKVLKMRRGNRAYAYACEML